MGTPKAFYSYMENEDKLNLLTDEQAGRLYKSLYAYSRTGEKPDFSDDPLLQYAFADFIIDIDRDRKNYEETCKRRSEAGKKGGQANATNRQAKEASACQEEAKQANALNNEAKEASACLREAKSSKSSETEAEAEAEADISPKGDINTAHVRETPDFDTRAKSVLDLFKKICTDFVPPNKLTEHRKRLIYQAELDKTDFTELFKRAQASNFLAGRSCKGDYKLGFDWVLSQKNRAKILEGNYDNPPPKAPKGGAMFSMQGASFDIAALEDRGLFDD